MIAGKEKIARYFEELLEKHGDHYLSLDWKSNESQLLRFSILFDIIAFSQKKEKFSILDVGCGIGHLYGFLKDSGLIDKLNITYKGIDISRKMIDFSRKKHPGVKFEQVDLINDSFNKKSDYVLCSGVFNIRMAATEDHFETVRKMLARMFALSERGVAVNFLAKSSVYLLPEGVSDERYVYFPEEEVIRWVRAVCAKYILRKDYHPGDFTVYMLK